MRIEELLESAAQQAAIAIAKKEVIGEFIDVNKAPENFDVYEDSYGSDYDFTVGKTKIEVTFKEYNENYYILAFENKTQSRPDTHAATGTERDTVFKIFNGVAYCLNHFIARHPKTEVIVMGAKSNEPSRIKLYDRAAKFFEQMGFKAVTDPVQQKKIFSDDASGYKLYVYKKKVSAPTNENFADGKGPGRPGDSQRHGIPKHATKSELEKASHAKGRKGQLARWQLNMRNGKS
jgi:hypothetical protein